MTSTNKMANEKMQDMTAVRALILETHLAAFRYLESRAEDGHFGKHFAG